MQHQHQQDARDQSADVGSDRDVARERERDDQVEDDQACDLAAGRDVSPPLEHEQPAEDPEDRARRADRDLVRAPEDRARRAGDSRGEIEEREAPAADQLLEQRAREEQRVHVHAEVEDPVVQECGRHDPPPVAVRDPDERVARRNRVGGHRDRVPRLGHPVHEQRAVAEDPVPGAARRPAGGELREEHRDVDADQRERHGIDPA